MKTLEEIINYYKDSIRMNPYGMDKFENFPELKEQVNMYQSLVKTACVSLNNLWESYNKIREEQINKLKDMIARCKYKQEIEHFEDGSFRLHFVRTFVPEDYKEVPDYSLKAEEKFSDSNIYLLVGTMLYRVHSCGGHVLTKIPGRSIQLTEEEATGLQEEIIPARIANWQNWSINIEN